MDEKKPEEKKVEEDLDLEGQCPPPMYNTFNIPLDVDLERAYDSYHISKETQVLESECGRQVVAEAFIENIRLGTLRNLAIRAYAKLVGGFSQPLYDNILDERVHYDAVDIDLPLEKNHFIQNARYWRKVVLHLSNNQLLTRKGENDLDWKKMAITTKFTKLLQEAPAEYPIYEQLLPAALIAKDYITELDLKDLKPTKLISFDRFLLSESDSEYMTPSQESETITTLASSSSVALPRKKSSRVTFSFGPFGESDEEEGEEEETEVEVTKLQGVQIVEKLPSMGDSSFFSEEGSLESESSIKIDHKDPFLKRQRDLKRKAKAEQVQRRAVREEKREKRMAKYIKEEPEPTGKKKKKKKENNTIVVKTIEGIKIEESEDDPMMLISDDRNLEALLKRRRRFKYPSAYCHHVDLSILSVLENLQDFSITFCPSDSVPNFQPYVYRCSYRDFERLATALKFLQKLKIFRLYNSEVDRRKLQILADALRYTDQLEKLDLSYNDIKDHDGVPLFGIVANLPNLKELILDNNSFDKITMHYLSKGLYAHRGSNLETLSIAYNPITNEGFHELIEAVVATKNFSKFNFSGILIDSAGVDCCIAWKLIHKHQPLTELSMAGVRMNRDAAVEVLKALYNKYKVTVLERRMCDIDEDLDQEMEILIARNIYMQENPYVRNDEWTQDQVKDLIATKQSVLLTEVEEIQRKTNECMENRPEEFVDSSIRSSESSSKSFDMGNVVYDTRKSVNLRYSVDGAVARKASFDDVQCPHVDTEPKRVVDFNEMDLEEVKLFCDYPGLQQKYFYLYKQRQGNAINFERNIRRRLEVPRFAAPTEASDYPW